MKIKVIYLVSCFALMSKFSCASDSIPVKCVEIHYIYSKTDTQHDISCDDFDAYSGKDGYMVKKLTSATQISQFAKSLDDFKTPPLVKNIDVRAKAYIHYSNSKTSIVCVDRFGDVMLDGILIGFSSSLILFLKSSCNGF